MAEATQRRVRTGYRADIDGLRAVAVLLVLFDHLQTHVSGGYVGVDVFFVISGYLISSVIMAEMAHGRFSVVGFYERRIRRIVPALAAMLAVTTVLAYHYQAPEDFVEYGKSLIAAVLSGSNLLFWKQAGYFDGPSSSKPLLHTWSLAVEEQFYIVFPLFLLAVRKWWPRRMKTAVVGTAVVTFALACWWVRRDASAAFFWAPLRAWELLLGTVISQKYVPAARTRGVRELATFAGMLLMLVPGFAYTAVTPFPGLAALPPCLGAALVIWAGETGESVVGKALSWRPVVFVGLISYSLYLWHWPVLVFQRTNSMLIDRPDPASRAIKVAGLVVAMVLGTLSWWLVEQPFRKGRLKPKRRTLFAIAGGAMAVLVAVGGGVVAAKGLPARFSAEELSISRIGSYIPDREVRSARCFVASPAQLKPSECFPQVAGKKNYLILGDSVAAELYPGISGEFREVSVWQLTSPNCFALADADWFRGDGNNAERCAAMSRYEFGDFLAKNHPDKILLAGHWDQGALPELGKTIAWLKARGFDVVLFGAPIEFDEPLPRVLFRAVHESRPQLVDLHWDEGARRLNTEMEQLARDEWHVPFISEFEDLCSAQVEMEAKAEVETHGCPVFAGPGVPLKLDAFHLTLQGTALFARRMRELHQLP